MFKEFKKREDYSLPKPNWEPTPPGPRKKEEEAQKILISNCINGLSLSHEAVKRYCELKYNLIPFAYFIDIIDMRKPRQFAFKKLEECENHTPRTIYYSWNGSLKSEKEFYSYHTSIFYPHEIERNDAILLKVFKEMGQKINKNNPQFNNEGTGIIEIPNNVEWEIAEWDNGAEYIQEKTRTWFLK